MEELIAQIAELRRKTQEVRLQFLNAEVETCYSALDFGHTELRLGSRDMAIKEAAETAKGIATIMRFLPELDDAAQRNLIQVQLEQLHRSLEVLKHSIEG